MNVALEIKKLLDIAISGSFSPIPAHLVHSKGIVIIKQKIKDEEKDSGRKHVTVVEKYAIFVRLPWVVAGG